MRGIPLRNIVAALVIVAAFGVARLPVERRMEAQLREQQFLEDNVDVPLLEQLGQGSFAAVLGGFSSLVASFYYINAHVNAFDKEDWAKVDQQFGLITTLQPRNGHYWDQYIWHIGWNAYAYALRESDYERRQGSEWKAWNLEHVAAPAYLDRAKEVGLKGASLVKGDFRLCQRMGLLYEDKLHDPCTAARWFERGSQIEGAPRFMHKIFANLLAQCPGAEDEAYPLIRERYWNPDKKERSLSVLILMEELEDRLARRELAEGVEALQRSIADEPQNYLHRAAFALYHVEVMKSPAEAMSIYEELEKQQLEGAQIPEFYKKKWALLAAGMPDRSTRAAAYKTLRELLSKSRWRLTPEEKAVIRPLEDDLDIPEKLRLFPSAVETVGDTPPTQ